MKRLLFLLVATLMTYSAQALILETIELKDGTVLQGYTAVMCGLPLILSVSLLSHQGPSFPL